MQVKCPHCGAVQNAPDEATGREALCKSCRQVFTPTPGSDPVETPVANESRAKLINWTAILLVALCAGGLGWAFGLACGGILTKPDREKVDAEIKTCKAQVAASEAAEADARRKLQAQMKKNTGLQNDWLLQHEYIGELEKIIEDQTTKAAESGETAETGPLPKKTTAGGFSYRNVHFRNNYGFTEVIGDITNASERDYDSTCFKMSVYDKTKRLLGTGLIDIGSFMPGQTRSFEVTINASTAAIESFKIDFDAAYK